MNKKAQDILILEPENHFAAQLVHTLSQLGSYAISVVPTLKEACLQLVQGHKDLAFIPVDEGAKIIRSLRAIQPDLRLILVTPTADVEIPVTYSGRVQGVLIKDLLAVDLPTILQEAFTQSFYIRQPALLKGSPQTGKLDTAVLVSTLYQADLGRLIQTVVISRKQKLLAYWGDLNEREAATVALHIGRDWPEAPVPARLQFVHLPARAGDLLLYTCHLAEGYLLTLVALPETPLSNCRQQAEKLIPPLKLIVTGQAGEAITSLGLVHGEEKRHGRVSYAIVWRPIEPLADALLAPLRQALLRLATANGCVLIHINLQPGISHIVATCPAGRDAGWAASLFKNGSEQILQQEYGVVVSIWETGYYATESAKPLSQTELNVFLDPIALS